MSTKILDFFFSFFLLYTAVYRKTDLRKRGRIFESVLKNLRIYLLFYPSTKILDSSILFVNSKKANTRLGLRTLFGS